MNILLGTFFILIGLFFLIITFKDKRTPKMNTAYIMHLKGLLGGILLIIIGIYILMILRDSDPNMLLLCNVLVLNN